MAQRQQEQQAAPDMPQPQQRNKPVLLCPGSRRQSAGQITELPVCYSDDEDALPAALVHSDSQDELFGTWSTDAKAQTHQVCLGLQWNHAFTADFHMFRPRDFRCCCSCRSFALTTRVRPEPVPRCMHATGLPALHAHHHVAHRPQHLCQRRRWQRHQCRPPEPQHRRCCRQCSWATP